jgi:hypothetical protein
MTDEERIRVAAHKIWEDVGQPSDQANLHWEMAEEKIEDAVRIDAPAPGMNAAPVLPILKTAPLV